MPRKLKRRAGGIDAYAHWPGAGGSRPGRSRSTCAFLQVEPEAGGQGDDDSGEHTIGYARTRTSYPEPSAAADGHATQTKPRPGGRAT
jgi:hypothetical protein